MECCSKRATVQQAAEADGRGLQPRACLEPTRDPKAVVDRLKLISKKSKGVTELVTEVDDRMQEGAIFSPSPFNQFRPNHVAQRTAGDHGVERVASNQGQQGLAVVVEHVDVVVVYDVPRHDAVGL